MNPKLQYVYDQKFTVQVVWDNLPKQTILFWTFEGNSVLA